MLLPDPDGPTMNVHDPAGTRNVTPRRASTTSSPLWNVLWTSTASIITAGLREVRVRCGASVERRCHVALCRIASIGVIREAFQAG